MRYIKLYEEYNTDYSDNYEFEIPMEEYLSKILKTLGYNSITKPLGEGMYGFASDIGDNKVLKITNEVSEAYYANILKDINSPNLVEIYDVVKVVSNYQYGNIYAIVMEKLNTDIHNSLKYFVQNMNRHNPITPSLDRGVEPSDKRVISYFKGLLPGLNDTNIMFVYNKWLNVYKECKKYDIPMDDFHQKNVGISKRDTKELVFFDVSKIQGDTSFIDDKNIKEINI